MIDFPLEPGRRRTRIVPIGDLSIGGELPPLLQSMITAPAARPERALAEIRALDQAGCRLIRLSLPTRKELDAIPKLRQMMAAEGIKRPLVADVHFSPQLAIDACECFEKVRINPGNFSDSPKNSRPAPDDPHWFEAGHLELQAALEPLAQAALQYHRAIRVGVNQGSLSERLMGRYGDSPEGMVRSALETCDLLESFGLRDLVVSLKSSNPLTVQKAYRLLVAMRAPKELLPLHLGVTEAGDGLMGRIKSLAGIGPLLFDGLGDTVRVSLTEPSEQEIHFGRDLLASLKPSEVVEQALQSWSRDLMSTRVGNGRAWVGDLSFGAHEPLALVAFEGDQLAPVEPSWEPDFRLLEKDQGWFGPAGEPVLRVSSRSELDKARLEQNWLLLQASEPVRLLRRFYAEQGPLKQPLGYLVQPEDFKGLAPMTELACLLGEGLVDFVVVGQGLEASRLEALTYLLQATRSRIFMTDYIACPSCSRTLFDLEATTAKIRARTKHLKGLKLGVMGCIVNGPGEMADADFGYVGSGPGKVDLYRGQERVRRNIDESEAVDALIELIKASGRWQEPTS
ncbi:MAG: (E)-4-hydroxy-3-methylbut-2-enyl-diphosphate synthase [bacterium]|nr:(E)-4-hydroxy-3-methylbut-2-enyl-diphosphate synthase [bacterium]